MFGENFLVFFGKFSILFSSLFSLFFFFLGNSYWWQLLPASASLIVWHFLKSCLPSFCLFIRSFKKDFLNLITYFSCHIFILNCSLVFYLFFSCFQFFLFLFNGYNSISYLQEYWIYMSYIFILFPAKSLMSPSLFLYSLVYFNLCNVKDVFSSVLILECSFMLKIKAQKRWSKSLCLYRDRLCVAACHRVHSCFIYLFPLVLLKCIDVYGTRK